MRLPSSENDYKWSRKYSMTGGTNTTPIKNTTNPFCIEKGKTRPLNAKFKYKIKIILSLIYPEYTWTLYKIV